MKKTPHTQETNPDVPPPAELNPTLGTFYIPHRRVYAPHSDQMITIQSAKDSCDINQILGQFKRTGIITHVNRNRPTYTDLPAPLDYQEALHLITEAEEAFFGLPSEVRTKFANDPQQLLAAIGDPAQADYLREVGILKPLPAAPPVPQAAPVPAAGTGPIPPPSPPPAAA